MDVLHQLNKAEEKDLFKDAIIVFDTSSLLNFYGYSQDSINEIFSILKKNFSDRLWIPSHVQYEFLKNREKPIQQSVNLYEELSRYSNSINEAFEQIKNRTKSNEKHPFVEPDLISKFGASLNEFRESLHDELKRKISELQDSKTNDEILSFVNTEFSVGKPYSYTETIEIVKEGELRYKYSIPPGYLDEKDKIGFQKFGDLIIWKQIIEKAQTEKVSVIFIVDDLKEDWWILDKNRKPILPREELILEIAENQNTKFGMYTMPQFISKLPSPVSERTRQEINKAGERNIENNIKGIVISAYDGSPHRIERLNNALLFMSNTCLISNIEAVHDHKGTIEVTWKKQPTDFEKESIARAWGICANEIAENVEHIIL